MRSYIYPENLRANVKLWFWSVRDFIIICAGLIFAFIVLMNLWNIIPISTVACYAFLTVRADEMSVLDYLMNAIKYFCINQQKYDWRG